MIIRAKVTTNSSEDEFARVKVEVPGQINEFGPIESVNGIPLKKGDTVYLDVSNGYECALILGKAVDKTVKNNGDPKGSILFESSNGNDWVTAYVKDNIFCIETSDNNKIEISTNGIIFNGGSNGGVINIQSLINAFNNHTHSLTGVTGTSSAGPVTITSGNTGSTNSPLSPKDIEDDKLKH